MHEKLNCKTVNDLNDINFCIPFILFMNVHNSKEIR
jgi:hypothetical protein